MFVDRGLPSLQRGPCACLRHVNFKEPTMLRLWIALLLVLLLIGAVVGALTRTEPKRLWAFALGLLCVGLIGGGLLWIFAP
jgi:hypothetical protein